MAMVISDSFPCFYTLTDVQWKHINTCFIRHGNSQQHTDTLHETEYACHYLGLHLSTVMAIYMYITYRNTSLSGISSIHIYADSRRHPAAVLRAAVVRDHRVREDIVELPDQRVPQDQVEQQALPVPQDLPGLRKPFAVTVRSR